MIKAVIFDYFGIICSDEYWQSVKNNKNLQGAFPQLSSDVNLGRMHWADFIQRIADKTGQSPSEIIELYKSQRIHPGVLAFVAQLHEHYQTALLTNANHEFLEPLILKLDLANIFDEIVISSKLGVMKPDRRIFEHLLEKLRVNAHQTIFIDDKASNTAAAAELGFHTVTYETFEQMEQSINRLLEV